MPADIPFSEMLELLESRGWMLQRIAPPYRIFTKKDRLPILIPVYDRMVRSTYVKKVAKILEAEGENS